MTLATTTAGGWPAARMVMLRGIDTGLVFFTDRESDKGTELTVHPRAALVLHWLAPAHRQVRVVGPVELVRGIEADEYWRSRRPEVRRSAVASHQSQPVPSRTVLEHRLEELARRFPDGVELSRPSRWCGYRVAPERVEFWQEATDGLHDRTRYVRQPDGSWTLERLSP
jgi:pyridoxamine 5'-phosphate oxidase